MRISTLLAETAITTNMPGQFSQLIHRDYFGNELWRYGLLILVILATLVVGRIVRFFIERTATRLEKKEGIQLLELFLRCASRPVAVFVFAGGLYFSRLCLHFASADSQTGFSQQIYVMWGHVSRAVMALAIAYFMYRLVDIVEYYLTLWTAKTQTTLDDMLVPIIRKTLRIFIVLVAGLYIADNILDQDIGTILAAAGIGGLAIALAAQETIANIFGSVNIFADRPFQIDERIRVGGFDGPVESVGLRSTRIRTLDGHLVSIPNSKIANDVVENIGRRPYIKRVANIGVTYDTSPEKVEKAVQIIKDILAQSKEINSDPEMPPRVYFSDFADFYLNILVIYWVKPPDYWLFQETNQKINLAIMRAYENEGIEFAFPTQTLYLKKEESN